MGSATCWDWAWIDFLVLITSDKHSSLQEELARKGGTMSSPSLLHHVRHTYSHLFISTMLESDCCYFQLIDSVDNISNLPQIWSLWVGKHLPLSFLVLNPTFCLPYSSQFVYLSVSTCKEEVTLYSSPSTFAPKCYWFDYTLKLPHLSDTVFFYSQNGDNYCWLLDTSQE